MCLLALPTTAGSALDPWGFPLRPGLVHQSLPGQSVVLCSGGATIHHVPEVLDCPHHPGAAATLQRRKAEHGHVQEEPRAHCSSLTGSYSGTVD